MEPSAVLRTVKGGVEVDILVTPHAKTSEVQGIDPWRKRLIVKVAALPTEGRANRAVCDLMSVFFGARAEIVRGLTERQKTVFLPVTREEAIKRLEGPYEGRGRDA